VIELKKGSLKILICALTVLLLGAVLTACNKGGKIAHYDYRVTFDYNEGDLVDKPLKDQYIGVMKNNLVSIRPGYKEFQEQIITAHYIEGWYLPKTDENGEVIVDETTKRVVLDRKWDFKNDRVNSDITLYANFMKSPSLSYVDIDSDEVVDTVYGKPGTLRYEPSSVTREGYTFLGDFYSDKQKTEFSWPHKFEAGKDTVVYVKFLSGVWSLVKDEDGFRTAMNSGSANIYLLNDLDFTGKTLWTANSYKGILEGNGHTVKINSTRIMYVANDNLNDFNSKAGGVFGELAETAYIRNITFEDISFGVNVPEEMESKMIASGDKFTGLFAGTAKEGAKLENVTISGLLCADTLKGVVTVNSFIGDDQIKDEDKIGVNFANITVLDGAKWTLATTAEEFREAVNAKKNIKLQNDVDFGAESQRLWYSYIEYDGEIDGGGHTVKAGGSVTRIVNVTVNSENNKRKYGGLFGVLKSTANIHDIKFVGIEVEFNVQTELDAVKPFGVMATVAEQGAKINNVIIEVKVNLDDNFAVNNWIAEDYTNPADVQNNDYSKVELISAKNN